jgi:2-aminoadipate transaminase
MPAYDFGSGRTDPQSFPTAELAEAARAAILQFGPELVRYPGDVGHPDLRQLMAAREAKREGVEVNPDHIALMNGSMQAVTLCAEALMRHPGDIIVCEELTYSGTISAYKGLGATLVGIPVDEDGMRMDALAETMADLHKKGTPPAFIYTLTTYQNPTGSIMPLERRKELLQIAAQYNAIVVEDNCYGDVHFEGEVPPSLYALDDSERMIYICSLSKILGPGVREGYVLARPPMLKKLLDRRFDGGHSALTAIICAEFFRDRLWQHIEHTNAILQQKRDAVFAGLEASVGDICSWSTPAGGMFVWVRFPDELDRQQLRALADQRGIIYAAGSNFHIRGEDIPYLRLAFGFASLEAIQEGVPLLGQSIRQACALHAVAV